MHAILVLFIIGYLAFFAVELPILGDTDTAWHIIAGDVIRAQGQLVVQEPWAFSGSGQVWYNISWLWDVVLSLLHQAFGIEGLYIFSLLCPALLLALLAESLRRRYPHIATSGLLFICFITIFPLFEFGRGRPQIVGLFLALAFHHIVHASRANPHAKSLFLLPVLMVLWVNIHGSFIAGFSVIGAYGLEALYTKNREWFTRLLLIGVLCLLALPINPYGVDMSIAVSRTLNSVIIPYVTEWQPFVFGNIIGASIWFLAFLFASNLQSERVALADKILAVIWLVAMLFSVRHIGLLAIFGAPYIAANLPASKTSPWLDKRMHMRPLMLAALMTVAASILLLPYLPEKHYRADPKSSVQPAVDYIMRHHPKARVLNDYNLGGPIIYYTKGKFPIFIDGRAGTAFSEQVINDYLDFTDQKKDWQRIISGYGIDMIMVANTHNFAKAYERGQYRGEWKKVFSDEAASVYVKR